jgi:outer membrane lipoprotein SlyB
MNRTFLIPLLAALAVGLAAPAAAQSCSNCGVVDTVRRADSGGSSSWVAPVVGGVLGGVVGNQFGSGSGRTAMTVLGAAGGAYAGKKYQDSKSTAGWEVVVGMDDGSTRTFSYSSQPSFKSGDRVHLSGGSLRHVR